MVCALYWPAAAFSLAALVNGFEKHARGDCTSTERRGIAAVTEPLAASDGRALRELRGRRDDAHVVNSNIARSQRGWRPSACCAGGAVCARAYRCTATPGHPATGIERAHPARWLW